MLLVAHRTPATSSARLLSTDGRSQHAAVDLPAVLVGIWHEAHAYRAAIHRSLSTTRCDLRVSASGSGQDGTGAIRLDGDCACRDFLVDMIVECQRVLAERSGELRNPLGAARVHMRMRAGPDWIRRRRTEMGAQSRTDRIRTGSRARGLPDEFHRALLEYLVDEAGSMVPLENQDALMRRLAVRCADEFGDVPEQYLARVIDGVAVIERRCRLGPRVNAGTAAEPEHVTWWERYIERPLGRRPRRTNRTIPVVPGEYGLEMDLRAAREADRAVTSPAEVDESVVAILVSALRHRPEAPAAALRAGISDLVAQGLLAEGSAAELLSDRARFALATQELSAVVGRFASQGKPFDGTTPRGDTMCSREGRRA